MRRIFSLALSLMIFAVMLCSCSADDSNTKNNSTVTEEYNITTEDVNDINTDKNSAVAKDYCVTLTTEKDVYDTNSDIVNYKIYNEDNIVITTGDSFLEKYENNAWINVDTHYPSYTDSYSVNPGESKEMHIHTFYKGGIEKGKYRVRQVIEVTDVDPETNQKLTVYGEFTVE